MRLFCKQKQAAKRRRNFKKAKKLKVPEVALVVLAGRGPRGPSFHKMASSGDVRDIMGLDRPSTQLTMDKILAESGGSRKKSKKSSMGPDTPTMKRPEGMARELYNLLCNDSKDAPPIIPTDSGLDKGYRHVKAKLGMRKVSF